MPGGQVDDAQPPMAEHRSIVRKDPCVVWPAVRDDVAHPDDAFAIVGRQPISRDDTRDSAH